MDIHTVTITDDDGNLIASMASDETKVIVANGYKVIINGEHCVKEDAK